MSQELVITTRLGFNYNDSVRVAGVRTTYDYTSGSAYINNLQTIGSTGEAVLLGDVTTPDIIYIRNTEASGFVNLGIDSSGMAQLFSTIPTSQASIWTPYDSRSIYAKTSVLSSAQTRIIAIAGLTLNSIVSDPPAPPAAGIVSGEITLTFSPALGATINESVSWQYDISAWAATGACQDDFRLTNSYARLWTAGILASPASVAWMFGTQHDSGSDVYFARDAVGTYAFAKLLRGGSPLLMQYSMASPYASCTSAAPGGVMEVLGVAA